MSLVIERSQSRLLGEDDRWLYGLETAFPAEHRRRHISPDDLIEKLQFEKLPFRIQSSVDNSSWYDIDNGRHMIEIPRNKRLNTRRTEAPIYIADFDDTLMDTTSWHHQEFGLISEFLRERDVDICIENTKTIYELSKINVPGKAESQTRYTPGLNLVLLSQYRRRRMYQGYSEDQAMRFVVESKESIQRAIIENGEFPIHDYKYDEDLLEVFIHNSTGDFVHHTFIDDFFTSLEEEDSQPITRIIITRGKIEGPLGQVHKVHGSGIMRLPTIDMVIYTNDLKLEPILSLNKILPNADKRPIYFFDDNPNEITPFYEDIKESIGTTNNLEIIHVRHQGAKRRDKEVIAFVEGQAVKIPPNVRLENTNGSSEFDHYFPTSFKS